MVMPQNFSFIWKKLIAGSAHPGSGPDLVGTLAELAERDFGAIMSLTEEPLDDAPLREFQLDYLHLPILDFNAPSQEQIDQAVEFLNRQVERERATLVHCRAGIGRTGTLLACFLVGQGMDPADAIAEVRRRRPGSCEVYAQEYAVHQFARRLRGEGGSANE